MVRTQKPSLRDQAIAQARRRMQHESFATIKMSDIARDLHVTHAALYKYFLNKQDLFDAVNIQWMDDTNARLRAICLSEGVASARIKRWFIALYSLRREKARKEASEYLSYIYTEALARPCAQEDALERKSQVLELVNEAIHAKEWDELDPHQVTSLLFNAADRFIHPAFVANHASQDLTAELAYLLDVMLRGLSVRAPVAKI